MNLADLFEEDIIPLPTIRRSPLLPTPTNPWKVSPTLAQAILDIQRRSLLNKQPFPCNKSENSVLCSSSLPQSVDMPPVKEEEVVAGEKIQEDDSKSGSTIEIKDLLLRLAQCYSETIPQEQHSSANNTGFFEHSSHAVPSTVKQATPSLNPQPIYAEILHTLTEPISPERKQLLLEKARTSIRYSHSVTKQNQKTEELYLSFTKQMDFHNPYPVTTETLLTFMIWLAESKRYTARSLDTVIYSSLCRLNILRAGASLDPTTQSSARALIGNLYRDPTLKKPRGGMAPIIPDDVNRMVEAMDKRYHLTPVLASLFNFALATGARGNSCGEVRLCDLGPLYDHKDGLSILVVTIVKLKARPNETLQVSLAGRINTPSNIDVLYWLDQHLQRKFDTTLRDVVKCNCDRVNVRYDKLWPYSTNSMTRFVKSRLEAAKISSTHFGFHSFRSGFMASCMIQADKRGESLEDVLIRCAIITGWKALGSVQFRYLRDAARRRMITTNMIGTTEAQSFTQSASFEKDGESKHANSFEYHILREASTGKQPKSCAYELKNYLSKLIYIKSASPAANAIYLNKCYEWCIYRLGKSQYETEDESTHPHGSNYSIIGRKVLDELTKNNPRGLVGVAEAFYDELKSNGKLKSVLSESSSSPRDVKAADQRDLIPYGSGMRRKPIPWSPEEESTLMKGIEENHNKYEIAKELNIRTADDVYDHVRHLNRIRAKNHLPPLHLTPVFQKHQKQCEEHDSAAGGSSSSTATQKSEDNEPSGSDSSSEDSNRADSSGPVHSDESIETDAETKTQEPREEESEDEDSLYVLGDSDWEPVHRRPPPGTSKHGSTKKHYPHRNRFRDCSGKRKCE